MVGLGGKLRDAEGVTELFPEAVVDKRSPVDALVSASDSADLGAVAAYTASKHSEASVSA